MRAKRKTHAPTANQQYIVPVNHMSLMIYKNKRTQVSRLNLINFNVKKIDLKVLSNKKNK
jgi:hypothetical protein